MFPKTYVFSHVRLDLCMEDLPPMLQMLESVRFQGSSLGLTLIVELDVPRLRHADEVNDFHFVAESEKKLR